MSNEVEIIVKSKDHTDFSKIGAKARASIRDSVKPALDDMEKSTTAKFSEIGDHSGAAMGKSIDYHVKNWSKIWGAEIPKPLYEGIDKATQEIDVKVKTKFKEVGEHSGRSLTGGLKNGLGDLEKVGSDVGTSLGQDVTKSAAQAGSAGGPYVMAAIGAVLVALAPAVGALAATALVFAFGAGLAGLGLMAAFHLKSVQKEFKSFGKFLHGFMNDIGKPFEQTWATIFNVAGNVLKGFQPLLKGAFKDFIAPAVSRFVLNLGEAFSKLGPAIRPVAQAFSGLLDALGPALPGIFKGISDALISMADTITKNPKLFAGFISGLLQILPIGLKVVGFLAKLFEKFSEFTHSSNPFKLMLAALSPVLAILMHLGVAGKVFHAIGDAVKEVAPHVEKLFDKIKDKAGPILQKLGDQIKTELVPAFVDFMHAAAPLVGKLIDIFTPAVVSSIKDTLDFLSPLVDMLTGLLKIASGLLSGNWSQMWDGMKDVAKGAGKEIGAALKSLLDTLTFGHGDKVIKITLSAINKVAKPVGEAVHALTGFAKKAYRATLTALNKVAGPAKSAISTGTDFAKRLYRANLTALSKVSGPVRSAISACAGFAKKAYRASLTALNKVGAALRDAINMGNNWARRVFTATFNVVKSIIPGLAHGGIVGGHAAEGGPRSNLTLVGEQGAELVNLPSGSTVYPHGQSMGMLGAGGGAQRLEIEWVGGNAGDSFMTWLKNNIRIRAGNGPGSVQKALGT